jgi:catechol 2,3-dioxygenase-like lactoylglutathione lyase family enzyme
MIRKSGYQFSEKIMLRKKDERRTRMPLGTLQHYTIEPSDLERTRNFYCDVLGLENGERPPLNFPGYWLYSGGVATVERDELRLNQLRHPEVRALRCTCTAGRASKDARPILLSHWPSSFEGRAAHGHLRMTDYIERTLSHHAWLRIASAID